MFGLNFEQYIWKPSYAENTTAGTLGLDYSTSAFGFQEPGLGVFGRVGILPKSRNPFNTSVSLGIGGRGIIPGRPFDRMGFAGYWLNDSEKLGGLLGALLEDEWGLEMFYNYAITPAIQASADFQYIDSSVRTSDDVFIFRMRLFLQL